MSILYQIEITNKEMRFIGRTRELEFFLHKVELKGNCDDEKWFDLVCDFWDNDCELEWDEDQKEVTEVIAAWGEARKIMVEADQCECPRSFNVKLIAIAPEMLELLERIVGDYGEVISGEYCEQAVDLIVRARKGGE